MKKKYKKGFKRTQLFLPWTCWPSPLWQQYIAPWSLCQNASSVTKSALVSTGCRLVYTQYISFHEYFNNKSIAIQYKFILPVHCTHDNKHIYYTLQNSTHSKLQYIAVWFTYKLHYYILTNAGHIVIKHENLRTWKYNRHLVYTGI